MLAASVLLTIVALTALYSNPLLGVSIPYVNQTWDRSGPEQQSHGDNTPETKQHAIPTADYKTAAPVTQNLESPSVAPDTHHEVFSQSTLNKQYFFMNFGGHGAINPSIIPHPSQPDVWVIVGQKTDKDNGVAVFFHELSCNARFEQDILSCIDLPMNLPVTAVFSPHCTDDLWIVAPHQGPRDARVFYGPEAPYAIWGSQSAHTCLGQWTQDFRMLTAWEGASYNLIDQELFGRATDLQHAPSLEPVRPIQKNWFLFWDTEGQAYAHYEINPRRSFAKVEPDGSAKEDLAPLAKVSDEVCMQKLMPDISATARTAAQEPEYESLHQATNSLSITLCKRDDPNCQKSEDNTFIMTVFQHKKYYGFHSVYDPYVMLFKQTAPFEVYGISSKPIWFHGRRKAGAPLQPPGLSLDNIPKDQSLMFYVASMNWKNPGLKYHGYLDDVVFLAFGIEDTLSAGIDVSAEDLLGGLRLCADAALEAMGEASPLSAGEEVLPMPR